MIAVAPASFDDSSSGTMYLYGSRMTALFRLLGSRAYAQFWLAILVRGVYQHIATDPGVNSSCRTFLMTPVSSISLILPLNCSSKCTGTGL